MSLNKLPDSVRRGLRTFFQSFIGIFLATVGTPEIISSHAVPHLSTLESALLAAVWGAVVAVLSFAQNILEDTSVMPALFKAPASPGNNPVPDPKTQ